MPLCYLGNKDWPGQEKWKNDPPMHRQAHRWQLRHSERTELGHQFDYHWALLASSQRRPKRVFRFPKTPNGVLLRLSLKSCQGYSEGSFSILYGKCEFPIFDYWSSKVLVIKSLSWTQRNSKAEKSGALQTFLLLCFPNKRRAFRFVHLGFVHRKRAHCTIII